MQNILSNWKGWTLNASEESSDDYTIIVPVYGHPKYFKEREELSPYIKKVVIALDLGGRNHEILEEFARELEEEGWRVHRTSIKEPGPPGLVLSTLKSGLINTGYILRMDADTVPKEDVGRYITTMKKENVELCSVRVEVMHPYNFVLKMQKLEYKMAMLSRRFRPWLTSGACFVGTKESVEDILELHTLWYPGEDVETGRIAHSLGKKLRHLDLIVETEAPETVRDFWTQRKLWWAGGFRHIVVNIDKNAWHMPVWTFYYFGLVVLGVLFKWQHAIPPQSGWSLFLLLFSLFVLYVGITFIANWQVRSWLMLLYPPYALIQTLGLPTIGAWWFIVLAWQQKRVGRYNFGYRKWWRNRREAFINIASILTAVFFCVITVIFFLS